jgi:hypothetical protein
MKILMIPTLLSVLAFAGCAQLQSAVQTGAINATAIVACSDVTTNMTSDQLCLLGTGAAITIGEAIASGKVKL